MSTSVSTSIATTLGVTIEISSRRGLRWAMVDLARRRGDGQPSGDVADGPAFHLRGVIEGFYGKPWSRTSDST